MALPDLLGLFQFANGRTCSGSNRAVEQIIWASTLSGSVRGLATARLAETATVVGAAALCSLVLRRRSLPTSWRLAAAALLYAASLLAVGLASGSFRDPRGF